MKTRKELKEEYKKMKFRIGIFQIRNLTNGKIYIGSSLDLIAAWNSQKLQLQTGTHMNYELQADWKKMGPDNFVYEIINEIQQKDDKQYFEYKDELKMLEEITLEELLPFEDKGYNKRKIR